MADDVEAGGDTGAEQARPAERDWMDRVVARVDQGVGWAAAHVRATREWMRDQPPARLWTLALGSVAAVGAAWLVLRLLLLIVGGVAGALFGEHEAAPPAPAPEPPPAWLAEIQHAGLWTRVFDAVHTYAEAAAPAAGTPGWLLLAIWGGIGAAALVGGWWSAGGRWLATTLAWWAWLAVTGWIIWTATPSGNPVPAGLVAALGVLVSVQPWTVLLVGALVAIGVLM